MDAARAQLPAGRIDSRRVQEPAVELDPLSHRERPATRRPDAVCRLGSRGRPGGYDLRGRERRNGQLTFGFTDPAIAVQLEGTDVW